MPKLYFAPNFDIPLEYAIQPIDYDSQITFEQLYQYVASSIGNQFPWFLSFDQQTAINNDATALGYMMQPQDVQVFIIIAQQGGQININAMMDGQQIQQVTVLDSMIIGELVSQLQQVCQDYSPIQDIQLFDPQGNGIMNQLDSTQPLSAYTQGLQEVTLNLVRDQSPQNPIPNMVQSPLQQQQQQSSPGKKQSSANNPKALLNTLILLKNITVLFDQSEELAIYKFHHPIFAQGYLKQSTGKEAQKISHFSPQHIDWVEKGKIKYGSIDDYGFAIAWENGSISWVKVKLQQ